MYNSPAINLPHDEFTNSEFASMKKLEMFLFRDYKIMCWITDYKVQTVINFFSLVDATQSSCISTETCTIDIFLYLHKYSISINLYMFVLSHSPIS